MTFIMFQKKIKFSDLLFNDQSKGDFHIFTVKINNRCQKFYFSSHF